MLGGFGWQALLPVLSAAGWTIPVPRPKFGHGAHALLASTEAREHPLHLFGCYHVSQQNTFTGRLTKEMVTEVLRDAARAASLPLPG